MKDVIVVLALASMLNAVAVRAQEDETVDEMPTPRAFVQVMATGSVAADVAERVAGHLEDSLPVRARADALDRVLAEAAGAGQELPVLRVIVGRGEAEFEQRVFLLKTDLLAVVNVTPLLAAEPLADGTSREELTERRIEKVAVGAVAELMSIEPCVFPRCVLWPVETLKELDLKARGPCPPCILRIAP